MQSIGKEYLYKIEAKITAKCCIRLQKSPLLEIIIF